MKTDKEIFDSYDDGNVIYMTGDGIKEKTMAIFIAQTPDNILHALNRTEKTIIESHEKNINSLKWINDYAVAKTIRSLSEKNSELTNKLIDYNSSVTVTTDAATDNNELQQKYDSLKQANDLLQDTYNKVYDENGKLNEKLKNANDLIDKYKNTIQDNKNEINILTTKLNVFEKNKVSVEPFNITFTVDPANKSVISYKSDDITTGANVTEVNMVGTNVTEVNMTEINTQKPNSFMSDEMPNMTI